MTKKDYELIAGVFAVTLSNVQGELEHNAITPSEYGEVMSTIGVLLYFLATKFKADNDKFLPARFFKKCEAYKYEAVGLR